MVQLPHDEDVEDCDGGYRDCCDDGAIDAIKDETGSLVACTLGTHPAVNCLSHLVNRM